MCLILPFSLTYLSYLILFFLSPFYPLFYTVFPLPLSSSPSPPLPSLRNTYLLLFSHSTISTRSLFICLSFSASFSSSFPIFPYLAVSSPFFPLFLTLYPIFLRITCMSVISRQLSRLLRFLSFLNSSSSCFLSSLFLTVLLFPLHYLLFPSFTYYLSPFLSPHLRLLSRLHSCLSYPHYLPLLFLVSFNELV